MKTILHPATFSGATRSAVCELLARGWFHRVQNLSSHSLAGYFTHALK